VAEQQLDGGIANAGRVVRVGPHVLRPSSPHSGSIHAFLRAVRHAGFDGASSPVGIDGDGRERLGFIDGEVPDAPYPDWSQSDTALRRRVDAGDPNVIAMWNRTGGSERYDRRRRWWTDHHDQFATALL
jgi:hypothetical protein